MGMGYLLMATMLWGITFTLVGDVVAGRGLRGALVFIAVRFSIASLALSLYGVYILRSARARGWRPWIDCVRVGAITCAGFLTQTLGLLETTPARSAFVTSTTVVFVPFLASFMLGRQLSLRHFGLSLLALCGVALVVAPGGTLAPNRGDAWTLACALCFAWQIIEVERALRSTSALLLTFGQILATCLFAWIGLALLGGIPYEGWNGLYRTAAITGLLCTSLCLLFVARGQARVSAETAALIFALEPICASLFDGYYRGRWLDLWQLGGGALVVLAAIGAAILERRSTTTSLPTSPPA